MTGDHTLKSYVGTGADDSSERFYIRIYQCNTMRGNGYDLRSELRCHGISILNESNAYMYTHAHGNLRCEIAHRYHYIHWYIGII